MLSLRLVRRFGTGSRHLAAAKGAIVPSGAGNTSNKAFVSKKKRVKVEEPALFRLKKEKNPEKLFQLFKENAHNTIVIENRYAFEDTVSRLAGAGRFDYIENLLEHQKTLPQGRREGFIIRIIMLYGKAGMIQNAIKTFYDMHLYGCPRTVKSFNAALKVLTQSHDLEAIESFLWDVPERFFINIDILSVNTVISSFCEMGILEKGYLFMVEMEKLDNLPMAKRIYSALHGAGLQPNSRIYQTMIHYLSKAGLCKDGTEDRMGKARFLVILAKKKMPPFSADILNMMRSVTTRS